MTLRSFAGSPPSGMPALTSVSVSQNVQARTVEVTATYSGVPRADDPTSTFVYLGTTTSEGCRPAFAVAMHPGKNAKEGRFLPGGAVVTTTLTRSGTSAKVVASGHSSLGTATFGCAYAHTQITTEPVQRGTSAVLTVEHVKRPALAVSLPVDRVGAAPKKWKKVKVTVRNNGDASAKNVAITLAGTGVQTSPRTVKVGTIKPGKSKTASVKVRISTAKTRKAVARASGSGGAKASAKLTVLPVKKATVPSSLSGRLYWGADSSLDQAWMNRTVWFVDKTWAYTRIATKGKPRCSAKVKGCVRYTYSPRTGAVKVGRQKGTVTSKRLVLGSKSKAKLYQAVSTPKKGTRFAVNLKHAGATDCGYGFGKTCYTYTWYLRMAKNGTFSEARRGLSSGGVHDWFLGSSKDERGRYRVLSNGRVELRYDSGKRVIQTIAVFQDAREKPSPAFDGLLLNGTKYYR